jgi:spoIIIJ-associated protein
VTEELRVEATGETVGEAKWSALRELERLAPGIDKEAVQFQVVSEGERGLLGVGYAPARVVALVAHEPVQAHPEEGPVEATVREVLERITSGIGVSCRVELRRDGDEIVASCLGRDLGLLIGKHGQTIDAVQYLVNAITSRAFPDEHPAVVVDAAGYRARRTASLEALAVRSAEQALASDAAVQLEPMTAVERKIVHVRLKEFGGVSTTSEGTEPNRFVVIHPAAELPDRASGPGEAVWEKPGSSAGERAD